MFRLHILLAAGLLATPCLLAHWQRLHVKVAARDGTLMCTNVFVPDAPGRYPAALLRTPYRKGVSLTPGLRQFVDRGYVVVTQDVRGRYDSQGVFGNLPQEGPDSEDTVRWIASQPWSDGRVVMFGGSYPGLVQWQAALRHPPALAAIAPAVSGSDEYLDRYYSRGGAFRLAHRLGWIAENFKPSGWPRPDFARVFQITPLRNADRQTTGRTLDFYQAALDHPLYDEYWAELSVLRRARDIQIPVMLTAGWYDPFAESDLDMFAALRRLSRPVHMLVGAWGHNLPADLPEADFGAGASLLLRQLEIDFFDAVLGRSKPPEPGIRYFVMGANKWREERNWPPPFRETPLYLGSRGAANSLRGDGTLAPQPPRSQPPDRFNYDPRQPVPSTGGALCCNIRAGRWGPLDQSRVEGRKDVLVYTSMPVQRDIEATGPVTAVLFVSSSAPDTDFTAKLVDVSPGGRARILCDGILRLRYREGLNRTVAYQPGQVVEARIPAGVTSHVFLRGHSIRLEISSSNFPRFDRNSNTGRLVAGDNDFRIAAQSVYHDRARPSRLLLPVRVAGSFARPLP